MSDPRYKNGIHKSSFQLGKQTFQDSPIYHGWEPVELREDGRRVWALSGTNFQMRRVTEDDKQKGASGEWMVFVVTDGEAEAYCTYSGSIEGFTLELKSVLVTC